MISKPKIRTAILTTASILIVAIMSVTACAPAAPQGQSDSNSEPTSAPTATLTPTPKRIAAELRRAANEYEEARKSGRSSTLDDEWLRVYINTKSQADTDEAIRALENAGVRSIERATDKQTGFGARPSQLTRIIAALEPLEGLVWFGEVVKTRPIGRNRQTSGETGEATPSPFDEALTAWQTRPSRKVAKVGIIDLTFGDLEAHFTATEINDFKFRCFYTGLLGGLQHTEEGYSRCSTDADDDQHGTHVLRSVKQVAPEAEFYLANGYNEETTKKATDWMIANGVNVIVASMGTPWDGPGDGTSPFRDPFEYSMLHSVNDAVKGRAIWVAAAGNSARRTWFQRNPTLASDFVQFTTAADKRQKCNEVVLKTGKTYELAVRWQDRWPAIAGDPRRETDLEISLTGLVTGKVTAETAENLPSSFGTAVDGDKVDTKFRDVGHPIEIWAYEPTSAGTYCVAVQKTGGPTPSWIQLLSMHKDTSLSEINNRGEGSIANPAEGTSDGMIATGYVENRTNPAVWIKSSRGPAPEPGPPNERTKPDLVAFRIPGVPDGTSSAAPKVAGMAALLIRALGDDPRYNTPQKIVQLLKDSAVQTNQQTTEPRDIINPGLQNDPNVWGHGIAALPNIATPTDVELTHVPCDETDNMEVEFEKPATGTGAVRYIVRLHELKDGVRTGDQHVALARGSRARFNLRDDRGDYEATVQACFGGNRVCSPQSAPSDAVSIPTRVCKPAQVRTVSGDETVTIRWNPEPDATGYKVEITEGDNTNEEPADTAYYVHRDLTNGTEYSYRVRALGPGGPSEWSYPYGAIPTEEPQAPTEPSNIRANPSINNVYPGARAIWNLRGISTPLWEVRIWDGTHGEDGSWRRTPFTQEGWNEEYYARAFHFRGNAIVYVTGLIPGTDYTLKFRGAREPAPSDAEVRSAWSDPVVVKTRGTRPTDAPDMGETYTAKMPPSSLTGTASGRSVTLSWAAHTNPNYTAQYVWRREAGVTPIDWTAIPIGLDDTSYTDTTMPGESEYVYRIRAEKANGKGGVSNAITLWVD